jgi:hypothetical protein
MLNKTHLKPGVFAIGLTGFAVTTGVLVAKWRAARRWAAIITEREQFAEVISSLPDASVSKFLAEYELLAVFEGSDRFGWKRDLCRQELASRRMALRQVLARSRACER